MKLVLIFCKNKRHGKVLEKAVNGMKDFLVMHSMTSPYDLQLPKESKSIDLVIVEVKDFFDAYKAVAFVNERFPKAHIILIGPLLGDPLINRLMELGVTKYVIRANKYAGISTALQRVLTSQKKPIHSKGYYNSSIRDIPKVKYVLSNREKQILMLLLQGKRTSKIALEMGLKTNTAKGYVSKILKVFNVTCREELLIKAKINSVVDRTELKKSLELSKPF